MFSLLLSVITKVCSISLEPASVSLWTEEELESFVKLWLVIFSAWIKTAMFLLYHSKGCNICELVLHKCYINDLHTTTCSGMLGHHICLPNMSLFILWRDTTSELWTPVLFPLYCYHLFTLLTLFTLLVYYYCFPLDTLIPLFTANRWDWQPHRKLGAKYLVVLCAGSALLLVEDALTRYH
jgi:hypothetical protein